jgi:hypothetical protein
MDAPKIDLTKAEQVIREVFDDDKWVKDEFADHLAGDLTQLSERLATCFALFPGLNEVATRVGTKQAALVAAFAFGVVDDVLVSTKLLVSGKLMPAGNLMRQAIEGIAVALLCSATDLLIVEQRKGKPVMARYWERLLDDDRRTSGHLAVGQLSWNRTTLGVAEDAVKRLKVVKNHYNVFSHPGTFGIASRVALGTEGQVYAGGHFDIDKLEGYGVEVRERIGLCGILPSLIKALTARIGG